MQPADSPFPCRWWGVSLAGAGLSDVRPHVGTYGPSDFSLLPPPPASLRGDFSWLTGSPIRDPHIGQERAAENAAALPRLKASAGRAGLALPQAFSTFVGPLAPFRRIRSCTDCFLALDPDPVESPLGDGHLVRFLSDSQGCLHWYLYLEQDGTDHAVVSAPDLFAPPEHGIEEEPPDPAEISFAAGSFEEFVWRFWVENEIWFAGWEKSPVPEAGREYLVEYRRRADARRGA